MEDIPYAFYNGSVIVIGTDIYMFGSSNNLSTKNVYKLEIRIIEEKTIVIETKRIVKIKLPETIQTEFSNAYIYEKNKKLEYPVYYGNGEEWINIKTQKASRSIITEDGKEIKTEDNKIIEKEEE